MAGILIDKASNSTQESLFISKIVDDLNDENAKLVFADWLEEQGDLARAKFVRGYAEALKTKDAKSFPSSDGLPEAWIQTIGARLCQSILSKEHAKNKIDELLKLAMPCLAHKDADQTEDELIPIGGTKFWGLPDLPAGTKWPQQKDCNTFFVEGAGIDPETYCGFVAQINFADFAGTQAGRMMPDQGLLSIFSCAEIESIGMVDAYVHFTPNVIDLERMAAPASLRSGTEEWDEANEIIGPRLFSFTEALDIPSPGSPFPLMQIPYDDPMTDEIFDIREEMGTLQMDGILGFTRPTSSDDPLPGTEFCKLICVMNTIEMVLNFCIRRDDLKAARFDRVELAFVDFD